MADPSHPSAQAAAADAEDQVHPVPGEALADRTYPSAEPRVDELMMLRRENQQLRELGADAVVEQAKGALMLFCGIGTDQAHQTLAGWAHECNIDAHTIADTLVNVIWSGGGHPTAVEPTVVRWLEEHLRSGREAETDGVASPSQHRGR